MPNRERITKEQYTINLTEWMEYVATILTEAELERGIPSSIDHRLIDFGSTRERMDERRDQVRKLFRENVLVEQEKLAEANSKRFVMLTTLMGKKASELADFTIVSVGGGPGDKICEPWFPRVASLTGANVINFDISPPHPVDQKQDIYTHIGGPAGDVFHLLLNETTIHQQLGSEKQIAMIECNNLIGNNVSHDLKIDLGHLIGAENNKYVIKMRQNLRAAAELFLIEGGVLAIDKAYWKKVNGKLSPIDEKGQPRTVAIFSEEEI